MGSNAERRFVQLFNETDHWKAQRAASSGSGGEADLPDVTFANDGLAFAAEEKTTSEPYIYVTVSELEALQAYASAYGMRAVIIGRFKGEKAFYVWNPNDMEHTDIGTCRGSPGDELWAAKIADPDGAADGIYPDELTSFHLAHALCSRFSDGITSPPANALESAGGEAE